MFSEINFKRAAWSAATSLLLVCTPSVASATGAIYFKTWDDFSNGFTEVSTDGASAKWFYFGAAGFIGNDGTESTGSGHLQVEPSAVNVRGEPAFSLSVAQEQTSFLPGGFDHVKWLAYANSQASSGYPGFDAREGHELTCGAIMSGRVYGADLHPFGSVVSDVESDLRLGSFAFNTIDFETYMVFDFFLTNDTIYAFYERLPVGRGPELGENYAAFSYAIPVASYLPDVPVALSIGYERTEGVVTWRINGLEVFSVDAIGYRLPGRDHMILDHGGEESLIEPRQIACGMGLFTLLDATLAGDEALVRLSSVPEFYFAPDLGEPTPGSFVDDESLEQNRIFGQGASLRVFHTWVSSLPSWWW